MLNRRRVAYAVDDLALLGSRGLLEKIAAALRLHERVSVKLGKVHGNVRVLRRPSWLFEVLYQARFRCGRAH